MKMNVLREETDILTKLIMFSNPKCCPAQDTLLMIFPIPEPQLTNAPVYLECTAGTGQMSESKHKTHDNIEVSVL